MSIELHYTVHSAQTESTPVEAIFNGQTVTAAVDRLVLELTSDDGEHGHTFRLPAGSSEDLAAQRARYQPGAAMTLTLALRTAQ